jgi:multiple sugar transport system permease protein
MPTIKGYVSYKSHKRRRIWAGYLFILPAMLGVVIFTIAPLLYSLYLSFTNWTVLAPKRWIGFDNYEKIFTEDYFFVKSLKVTAYYSLGSVVAIILFSFIIGMLLNSIGRGKAFFRAVFYLPTVIPMLAGAICWIWMFNVDFGIINYALGFLGIDKQYWVGAPNSVIPSLIIIAVWGAGNVIIIFMAGMQGIPKHLLEAIEIDGGGWWRKLRSITIPLISPVIFYNVILTFINSLTAFTQTYVLGRNGGGPNDSALFYSFLIYREAFKYQNMGYACALAMVLFIIVAILTYLLFKLSSKWVHYEGGSSK